MARPARRPPRDLVSDWPEAAAGDPVVEAARRFALALSNAIGERSLRSVARETGVDRTVISSIIAGGSWPDIATLARLEAGLRVDLWPGRADD